MRFLALLAVLSLPASAQQSGVRYCAFGGGNAGVQGELTSFSIQVAVQPAAPADSPIPISDQGVASPDARAKARVLLALMLAQSPASIGDSLRRKRVFLTIIPKDKKLTDLPQFASLRGVRLSDGRTWDDIRGVGFVSQSDGTIAVGAGEENFLEGEPDGYPKGFLLAHEFSHAIHGHGLSGQETSGIKKTYRARQTAKLDFPSDYASTNEFEYFAVSASGFFDRKLASERGIDWTKQNDVPMFELLGRVYGTPRSLWSTAPAAGPGPVASR